MYCLRSRNECARSFQRAGLRLGSWARGCDDAANRGMRRRPAGRWRLWYRLARAQPAMSGSGLRRVVPVPFSAQGSGAERRGGLPGRGALGQQLATPLGRFAGDTPRVTDL